MTDSQALIEARSLLLAPNDLDETGLVRALATMHNSQIDYADLYLQHGYRESWSIEDGIVRDGEFGVIQGVGVRAVAGECSALAFSDELSLPAITRAAARTRAVSRETRSHVEDQRSNVPVNPRSLYPAINPIRSMAAADKVALLEKVDRLARRRDPRVVQVMATLSASYDTIMVLRSDDRIAADARPLVRLSIQVIVESNGQREIGHSGGGGRAAYDLIDEEGVRGHVDRAVDSALAMLDAVPAPAGAMTVVCGAGWPGVLLHEAVGHGLEGDFNRKGTSAFAGRIGERVAAKGVTIVDDGTLTGRRGSLTIDDEGTPTTCTTLIEDGILTGYMHDALSARLAGVSPTGNGRRQSYAHAPMPRMTNTYMLGGAYDAGEIIASVKNGIYATDFSGGQVNITNGRFSFEATGAYLIEDGRVTAPVKGATLIGNGPESLKYISMVGNDFALDHGVATCGKDGQEVPVGVGQPTLRIDGMTVGGTA